MSRKPVSSRKSDTTMCRKIADAAMPCCYTARKAGAGTGYKEIHILAAFLRKNEISFMLGFEEPSYFSRTFTKVMGVPPSEFRKEHD